MLGVSATGYAKSSRTQGGGWQRTLSGLGVARLPTG
jgi:hypothetical protein